MIGRSKRRPRTPGRPTAVHNPPPMTVTGIRPRPALEIVWVLWLAPPGAENDPDKLNDINLGGIYATHDDAKAALLRFPAPAAHNIQRVPIGYDFFAHIEMTRVEDPAEGENGS